MRAYTDADIRRAQSTLSAWGRWLDAHPHEWGQVVARATTAGTREPVGINRLIDGLVPSRFAPCAAHKLMTETGRAIRVRPSLIDLIYDS